MRDRILAVLLFSSATGCVWLVFAVLDDADVRSPRVGGVGALAVGLAVALSAWRAPALAADARAGAPWWHGAAHGAVLAVSGYAAGVVLLAVGGMSVGILVDPAASVDEHVGRMLLVGIVGVFASVTYLSPGLVIGALVGAVFYRLVRGGG